MASLSVRSAPYEELASQEKSDLEHDVRALIKAARGMSHPRVQGETLKIAWFLLTERGKSRGRKIKTLYRTRRAVEDTDARVIHEHVVTRQFLSWAALLPEELYEVLLIADACLTTKDEHDALGRVDPSAFGWERYKEAGIEVLETRTFTPVDLDRLIELQLKLRGKIEEINGQVWRPGTNAPHE